MSSFWTYSLTLRGLNAWAMFKAFLRYRNPRRQRSGVHQTQFYDRIWEETAHEMGATFRRLGSDINQIELDGVCTRVMTNVTAIDDPVTLAVAHDKCLTHQLLTEAGLPVPRHARFTLGNVQPAVEFMRAMGGDCVVKPAGGTGGGRGVTTGIRKVSHLARAAAAAAVYADELMIEEQIEGDNYRLLYLDGELLDAYVRKLPSVTGDGKSTVAQLVDAANEQRLRQPAAISQVLLSVDLDMQRTLERQGLSLRSVPQAGQSVTLKTVVNENSGADNATVTHALCPSIIKDGAQAARALRLRFAGIDIVVRDHTVPLRESGGVILEVNGTPNLYFHYHKQDGATPIAPILLRRLLAEDSSVQQPSLEGA